MNKKLMTLAVAGAFAAPAAAFAQASNVQIFGTMYMEYAYAKQGVGATNFAGAGPAAGLTNDQYNVDILQSPGSEIGIKGEEALGGGMSAWFQCASTADIRGSSTAGFCSRNSAVGVKGGFGNIYFGSWDMPMKRTGGTARITSDTGIFGVGRMLYGDSSTFGNSSLTQQAAANIAFSRRQQNSLFYDTPVFSGFQGFAGVSTTTQSVAQTVTGINGTTNVSGAKPRMWSVAGTYTNGPLYATLAYENHTNYSANNALGGYGALAATLSGTVSNPYAGTDTAWHAGGAYQFGPVKLGVLYTSRKYDMTADGQTNLKVTAWNIAGEWAIQGPHALRGGYTKANNTSGNSNVGLFGSSAGGGLVANNGAGQTGGNIWQVQYVYNASKRTEFTAGYVALQNDSNARYSLGGLSTMSCALVQTGAASTCSGGPAAGVNQSAFAVSIKNTF